MCGVDIADQLRSYYNTNRVHRKTWKPLFSFLLDTMVGNSYMLSSYKQPPGKRALQRDSHLQFCRDLRDALLHSSVRPRAQPTSAIRKGMMEITWLPVKEHQHVKIWRKQAFCSACARARHTTSTPHRAARKPLADLSENTTRKARSDSDGWKRSYRTPRTLYGCSVCRIPLCTRAVCWAEHLAILNSKD
jgi:hypothetical protein